MSQGEEAERMLTRMRNRMKDGFTLIELMVVVAIIGILAAVAIPAFMKNARKAKTAEAVTNVKKLYDGARSYYEEEMNKRGSMKPIAKQFPKSGTVPLVNPAANACCGQTGGKCDPAVAVEANGWKDADGTWNSLKFSMDDPHYYWYSYQSSGSEKASRFTASANGNLNCDAVYSTFELQGMVNTDGSVTGQAGIYRNKELE
jgi:prepilin-type N-terminal cleavage/methylation domain-containing protein